MTRLIIIGAGGFGREVYWLAHGIQQYFYYWHIAGFLDDRPHILDGYDYPVGVLGSIETYTPQPEDVFICGLGTPEARKDYSQKMMAKGGQFTRLIHPSIATVPNVTWGNGIIVCPFAAVSCDSKIGDFSVINSYSIVGHDVEIGAYAQINSYAFLGGNSKIGQEAVIHPHAVIMPNGEVGDKAIVGAGSVVLNKVKAEQTVFGVPAMPVKH